MKIFKHGMYGGKFEPFHEGHLYCLETAAFECKKVSLILFAGGEDEERINNNLEKYDPRIRNYLDISTRIERCKKIASHFNNVKFYCIDISGCRNPDGTEDWDAETPMVLDTIGEIDAVYGSEVSYGEYFKRAYPNALYRLLDPMRIRYPISGTMIRELNYEDVRKYIVLEEKNVSD